MSCVFSLLNEATVYMAPEVLNMEKYTEKADVYSFGIVLWELFTGRHPYDEKEYRDLNHVVLIDRIANHNIRPSIEGLEPSIQQLIKECWCPNPVLRPSFPEAVVRLRRIKASTIDRMHESYQSDHEAFYPNDDSRNSSSEFASRESTGSSQSFFMSGPIN